MWFDWEIQERKAGEKCLLRRSAAYIALMLLLTEAAFLVAGVVLSLVNAANKTQELLAYAVVYALSMLLPAVFVSLVFGKRYFPLSPCRRTNAPDAFFGILAAVGMCMLANIIASVVMAFFESLGVEEPTMPDYLEPNIGSLLLNLLVFAVLPALLEELVYRGYVLRVLRVHGDWFAVAVSAVLFGLMHGNVKQIPFALVVGFALGWLYIMTDNIWLPVSVHFANNAFAYLMDYFALSMTEETQGVFFSFTIMSLSVVGMGAFAVLLARRSELLRRLPQKSTLLTGERIAALFSSPLFIVSLVVLVGLTVLGS